MTLGALGATINLFGTRSPKNGKAGIGRQKRRRQDMDTFWLRARGHVLSHRRLAVLVHVALLAVVGAAEGAALVELDEHRVRSVSGAVDVDAVLVVGVA